MRLKSILSLLFAIAIIQIIGIEKAEASHSQGADISYVCLGNDSFLITLNFYRDCDGIVAPASASIDIESSCASLPNLVLSLQNPGGTEVSPLCPAQLGQSECNGGNLPGVEQYNYSAIVVLPQACTDWTFSYSLCCRNPAITNLQSPDTRDIYVEATLNNTISGCNNSPQFTSLPVPFICANQPFNYNHGAIDADGDSLVYSSINPLDAGAPIPYTGGFSPLNPLNTAIGGAFTINPETGQMSFTPNGTQVPVITVFVEEYRNGVLIGTTMRDIQVRILNCTNNQPELEAGGIQNPVGGNQIDSISIEVCPGESLSFDVIATDPDAADILSMTSNVAQSIPGATFTTVPNGIGDTVVGTFAWVPTNLDTGNNVFTVEVSDGACPIIGRVIFSFNVFVLDGTDAGPDLYYCTSGVPAQLNATGGSNFTWTPSGSLNNANIPNPLATPTTTTDYIVTSNLSPVCKNSDTVTVFVVPNFSLTLEPMNDTVDICRNSLTQLEAITDTNYEPYTYSWTPGVNLNNPNIANPLANPDITTNYVVTVVSDTGCTVRDSILVEVIGVGPLVRISTDDNGVCPGDTVNLTSEVLALSCGPSVIGCSAQNPPSPSVILNTTANTFFGTPFQGNSPSSRYQALYLASDLNAAGITIGTITRLQFDVGTKASDPNGLYENFTIKLGCTDNDNLELGQWENAPTTVFGPSTIATSLGSNNFSFQQQYDWDGVSNLVVEICYTNPNSIGGNDELRSTSPLPYNASMRSEFAVGADGCTLSPPTNTNGFLYNRLPNTTFFICDALSRTYTYSWTPTTGLTNPTGPNTQAVVNGEITYTLSVSDTVCDGSDFITLNIDTSFDIQATNDTTLCGGDSVQLDILITGEPPLSPLNCGVNGTTCTTPSTNKNVGSGTASTDVGTPYKGFWETSKQQYLFRASELQAAGVRTGTISELAWFISSKASSFPYEGFSISIGCTNISTMPAGTYYTGPMSVVYNPRNYISVPGINNYVLDNPFDWDGISNLVVEVCFTQSPGNWSADDQVFFTSTPFNSVIYGWTDGIDGCSMTALGLIAQIAINGGGDFGVNTNRPNIQFTTCNAPPGEVSVNWTTTAPGTLTDPNIIDPVAFPTTNASYFAEVTFVNGCVRYDTVDVDILQFSTSLTEDTSICEGERVILTATGGDTYTWTSTDTTLDVAGNNAFATPDTTTTYYVTITDTFNGCSFDDSVTVTVFENPFISFGNDSLLCFVDSIQLVAGAGFASYDWSTSETTPTIYADQPGVYSVTVTDANDCSAADTVELKVSIPPTLAVSNDTVACLGDTVSLTVSFTDPNLTLLWSTGDTTPTIGVAATGLYTITVTDTSSCPSTDSVSVIFNDVTVNLQKGIIACPYEEVLLVAGPDGRNYSWSTGSTDSSIIVVPPGGGITVTVTDSLGCTDTDSTDVGFYQDMSVDLGADTITCNNGIVTFNAGAGYDSYDWSTGSISQTTSVTTDDTVSVVVVDPDGCIYSDTVIVTDITPVIDIGDVVGICEAGDTVTLIAPSGYTTYDWSTQAGTQSIEVNAFGNYSVTVTDANGCTGTDDVDVVAGTIPNPDLGPNDSICDGQQIVLEPGIFEEYIWSNNTFDSILVVDAPGTYWVTVFNSQGCSATDTIVIVQLDEIIFADATVSRCQGSSVVISAPNGFTEYTWSTGDSTTSITVDVDGTYSFSVVDANGCDGSGDIIVVEQIVTVVASADPKTIGDGQSSTLTTITTGSNDLAYDWTPAASLDDPNLAEPAATPTENTIYTVTVTDSVSGCSASDTTEVLVGSEFAIPDGFTPNGDGLNDLFEILSFGNLEVIEFRIYNRWGELIFDNPNGGWDGTYEGEEQPAGSYIYYVEVKRLDTGEVEVRSDAFSLFR